MAPAKKTPLDFIENGVRNYRIFIDTCSLLSEGADRFWGNVVPLLEKHGKNIVLPLRVYQEVQKFATHPEIGVRKGNPHLAEQAAKVMRNLQNLKQAGLIQLFGETTDNFADNVFQTVFTKYRMKYNLMLITKDHNLSLDILAIGNSRAVNTRNRISVVRIQRNGTLRVFNPEENGNSQKGVSTTGQKSSAPKEKSADKPAEKKADQRHGQERKPQNRPHGEKGDTGHGENKDKGLSPEEMFAVATQVTAVSGSLEVTELPEEGSVVTAEVGGERAQVSLQKAVASGGEGSIYLTDLEGVVAKIYKKGKLDRAKFEKLRLMMSKKLKCPGICLPLALLYNSRDEFVGYLMEQAKGKELQRCVFIPQLLRKTFPDWTKTDTVKLCITILKKLKYLHDRNVILGDINPNNILVESPTRVYFVDTDSYQVEGYPCPVGTINFTAPEIQRKEYSTFLRSIGNERFAVATLLFMIMLPGKPPYALQGGENQIDNIINGDFAYASGTRSTGKAPDGMWRFCWSHLPRFLKDDFYETFRKDGANHAENKRFSTSDWLYKFNYYLKILTDGTLKENDEMSLSIFPTRLKKNKDSVYVTCKLCGNEVEEDRTQQGICNDCLYKKGEIYRCSRCNCEMLYTNFQKYIRKAPRHEICDSCFNQLNSVYTTITCQGCGQNFNLTWREYEFYQKKGFNLPKYCPACRQRRKQGTLNQRPVYVQPPHAPQKSGFCYLTTAACTYFGRSDDCRELTLLRRFRDGWLAQQPYGREMIETYYATAPQIVKEIEKSPEKAAVYGMIWRQYILPCVFLIELGLNAQCRDLYRRMVEHLSRAFLKDTD